jgi:hypothetical protein
MQGFGFLWCRRPVEGRFRPLIQAVYIRIYTGKPYIYVLYGVYIRRLKFTYGVYEYGYGENLFIHTYIYGTYLYGVYILIRFGPTLLIYAPYMTAFMGVTLLLDGKYAPYTNMCIILVNPNYITCYLLSTTRSLK